MDPGKDHCKPVKTVSTFNSNHIQYESIVDKDKNVSIKNYIDIIRSTLNDIINNNKTQREGHILSGNIITNYKTQRKWEIYLTTVIKFISFKDSNETRIMHSESDNIEIMIFSKTEEIIEELFKSLLKRSQDGLEKSMKGSEFIFDSTDILYYNLNKISLDRGGSDIDSPNWL